MQRVHSGRKSVDLLAQIAGRNPSRSPASTPAAKDNTFDTTGTQHLHRWATAR